MYCVNPVIGRTRRLLARDALVLVAAMLTACATLWDPAEHGVSIKVTGTDKARITHVDVFRRGHGLRLVGEVDIDTKAPMLMKIPGEVAVLVKPAGGGPAVTYGPDAYRHIHDHDVTYQRFSFAIDMPGVPSRGSEIHLIYRGAAGE